MFDCSRVLEYAKIRTVLQSTLRPTSGDSTSEKRGHDHLVLLQ